MKKILVIMAAGMGSRFGGLKQIEPIDEQGSFILDYSIYDAIRAGFNKVILIIKEENRSLFENTIEKRLNGRIELEYVYQDIMDVPYEFDVKEREKPWGTAQAIYCLRNHIDGDFVVINADDFYGFESFQLASSILEKKDKSYTSIAYPLKNSLWNSEIVKRGVLICKDTKVNDIIECSIEVNKSGAIATPLNGLETFELNLDAPVSMNMFVFRSSIFNYLEEYINNYFAEERVIIFKGEILLPEVLRVNILNNKISLNYILTSSRWLGMTYKEDLEKLKKEISLLKESGKYPDSLYN